MLSSTNLLISILLTKLAQVDAQAQGFKWGSSAYDQGRRDLLKTYHSAIKSTRSDHMETTKPSLKQSTALPAATTIRSTEKGSLVDSEEKVAAGGGMGFVTTNQQTMASYSSASPYALMVGGSVGVLLLLIIAAGVLFVKLKRRQSFRSLPLFFPDAGENGHARQFDVFLSYAEKDTDFVYDNLLNELRGSNDLAQRYNCCVHHEYFEPGVTIWENIEKAVNDSRVTVVVLTAAFIESRWCKHEFRSASYAALGGAQKLIVIVPNDDLNLNQLDKELRIFIQHNVYLEWENTPRFWSKFRNALGNPNTIIQA